METIQVIDTIEKKEPVSGYGQCQISNCSCIGFTEQSGNWPHCANCGHEFADHY